MNSPSKWLLLGFIFLVLMGCHRSNEWEFRQKSQLNALESFINASLEDFAKVRPILPDCTKFTSKLINEILSETDPAKKELYYLDHLQEWAVDLWGQPLNYYICGEVISIWSNGKNRKDDEGLCDDIVIVIQISFSHVPN